MFRILTAAAAVAAISLLPLSPAQAATAPAKKTAAKKSARKPPAEPVAATNDDLNAGQLSIADRVLTGTADCEFKQTVEIEKIAGHSGNFKVTFDRKTYVMVPEETTTGAIRLVDTGGAVVWIQIPVKSMLMNQKEHHRLVDSCQQDEQRIAVLAAQQAAANAATLARLAATPAEIAASANAAAVETAPPGATVSTVSTTTVTTVITKVPPPAPVPVSVLGAASAPATGASSPQQGSAPTPKP